MVHSGADSYRFSSEPPPGFSRLPEPPSEDQALTVLRAHLHASTASAHVPNRSMTVDREGATFLPGPGVRNSADVRRGVLRKEATDELTHLCAAAVLHFRGVGFPACLREEHGPGLVGTALQCGERRAPLCACPGAVPGGRDLRPERVDRGAYVLDRGEFFGRSVPIAGRGGRLQPSRGRRSRES